MASARGAPTQCENGSGCGEDRASVLAPRRKKTQHVGHPFALAAQATPATPEEEVFAAKKAGRHHWRCRGQGGAGRGQTRSGRGSGSAAARQPMPLRRRRFSRGHGRRALVARADSRSVKRAARVSSEETHPWRAHTPTRRGTHQKREREREREREAAERESESPSLPYSTYFPVL